MIYGWEIDQSTYQETYDHAHPLAFDVSVNNPDAHVHLSQNLLAATSNTIRLGEWADTVVQSHVGCVSCTANVCNSCSVMQRPPAQSPDIWNNKDRGHPRNIRKHTRQQHSTNKEPTKQMYYARSQNAHDRFEKRTKQKHARDRHLALDSVVENDELDQTFSPEERRLLRTLTEYVSGKPFDEFTKEDLQQNKLYSYVTILWESYTKCLKSHQDTYHLINYKRLATIKEQIKSLVPYEKQLTALRRKRMGQGIIKTKDELKKLFDSICELPLSPTDLDEEETTTTPNDITNTSVDGALDTTTVCTTPRATTTTPAPSSSGILGATSTPLPAPPPFTITAVASNNTPNGITNTSVDGTLDTTTVSTTPTTTTPAPSSSGILGTISNLIGTVGTVASTLIMNQSTPSLPSIAELLASEAYKTTIRGLPDMYRGDNNRTAKRRRAPNWTDVATERFKELIQRYNNEDRVLDDVQTMGYILYHQHGIGPYNNRTISDHLRQIKNDAGTTNTTVQNTNNTAIDTNTTIIAGDSDGIDNNDHNDTNITAENGHGNNDDGHNDTNDNSTVAMEVDVVVQTTPRLRKFSDKDQTSLSTIEKLLCWLAVFKFHTVKSTNNTLNTLQWKKLHPYINHKKLQILDANNNLQNSYEIVSGCQK